MLRRRWIEGGGNRGLGFVCLWGRTVEARGLHVVSGAIQQQCDENEKGKRTLLTRYISPLPPPLHINLVLKQSTASSPPEHPILPP